MAFFRPLFTFTRQLWFALDTANALRHGGAVSAGAQRHCMAQPTELPAAA